MSRILEGERQPSVPYSRELKNAVELAEKGSLELGGYYTGTADLILGLSQQKSAKELLAGFGITTEAILQSNMPPFHEGQKIPNRTNSAKLSHRARKALEYANFEADITGAQEVAPRHLIIGILREQAGVAVPLMEKLSGKTSTELLTGLKAAA